MIEKLNIGQIINTHGINGELKINPLTDDLNRFKSLKYVLIDDQKINVISSKIQNDKVILKIEGVNSIDDAFKLKGKYIKINREDAVSLEKDTYFIADLEQCEVFDTNGLNIGKVFEVIKTGSNDVYWVKGKEEVLIPAIKDIIENIDIENLKITIKPVKEWQG